MYSNHILAVAPLARKKFSVVMADDGGDDVPHEFMCPITKEVKNHIRKIKGKAKRWQSSHLLYKFGPAAS